jgi:small subunit ribosomal protein S17
MNNERKRQSLIGEVTSFKMDKTVTVKVKRQISHPTYGKIVNRYKNYLAHIESVKPNEGDIVKLFAVRPISKHKRWQVCEIIRKSVKLG